MHVAVNMEDNKAYTLRAKFIDHNYTHLSLYSKTNSSAKESKKVL